VVLVDDHSGRKRRVGGRVRLRLPEFARWAVGADGGAAGDIRCRSKGPDGGSGIRSISAIAGAARWTGGANRRA
jgi:hypothetical protein